MCSQRQRFLETKYGLDISAGTVTNINRAIAHGFEKGYFALPKGLLARRNQAHFIHIVNLGPSGKVKLAPKARSDAGKEVREACRSEAPV
jgi:histone H1/5